MSMTLPLYRSYRNLFSFSERNHQYRFWISRSVTTAAWLGSYPKTTTGQLKPVLANKKAAIYPTIQKKHNKKYMPRPTKANMSVVPINKRVTWDSSTQRNKYIKAYIDKYGNPKWNWFNYDIHHVTPREYGGKNTFNNLFPLPREIHQQVVNSWWSSY